MWLDWSRLLTFKETGLVEELLLSRRIKLGLSLVVALLVWITGKNGLSSRDRIFMNIVFAVFFVADILFYNLNYTIGIAVFSLAQTVFIIRNSAELKALFSKENIKKRLPQLCTIAGIVLAVNTLILLVIFLPHAKNPLFPIIVGYSVFLCCSLFIGLTTRLTNQFPNRNSWFIAIGISMLYVGDLMVGLNIILPRDQSYIISTSLTWFFYLPAIVLFALSGYNWEKDRAVQSQIDILA